MRDSPRPPGTVDLDAIADAITADLLLPYTVPQRPLSLGSVDALCIRSGYQSRSIETSAQVARPDPAMVAPVTNLAARIATALGTSMAEVVTDTMGAIEEAGCRGRVLICADMLSRLSDPLPLLRTLRRLLEVAPVLVISAPLRALTRLGDHPGPPARSELAREWTFPELHALLDALGLDIVFGGILPRVESRADEATGVFIAVGAWPRRDEA